MTLKLLTDEVNNNDYLITVAPFCHWVWCIRQSMNNLLSWVAGSRKICSDKDLGDFDKGQIVMARWLGLSISKMAGLMVCSRYKVVRFCQRLSNKKQLVNWQYGHRLSRLIYACGQWWHITACWVVWVRAQISHVIVPQKQIKSLLKDPTVAGSHCWGLIPRPSDEHLRAFNHWVMITPAKQPEIKL